MLNVQKFLSHNSLDDLKEKFGIRVKVYDKFVGLNYDQIESPKSHPITVECRSLKLVNGTWEIASRSFDRFFNYGECPDQYKDFNFKSAYVLEKVDGSIIPIWYNKLDLRWEISSRSAIFGESILNDTGITFRQTVLNALNLTEEEFQTYFNKIADINFTYIFEYIGPDNFIVTPYQNKQLVLLGIRNNSYSGEYLSLNQMESFVSEMLNAGGDNIRTINMYKFDSIDNMILSLKELKNLEEGYVCWDHKNDIRIKVKSPQYVTVHHMRGEISREGLINLAISGETDEFLVYFPHIKEKLDNIKEEIKTLLNTIKNTYDNIHHIKLQKDFAIQASKHKYRSILFSARKNKTTIEHEFHVSNINYKLNLLG